MSDFDFRAAVLARLRTMPSPANPLAPVAPGVWRRKRPPGGFPARDRPLRLLPDRPWSRERMALRCGRGSRMSRPFLAAIAILFLALPARAATPLYTTSVGPVLQYDLSSVGGRWTAASLDNGAAAGISYSLNFLPNSIATVRWLSVWCETLFGGQTAGAASTFNWLAAIGLGTYNNLVSIGVGVPFVSASASNPLTGIFVGRIAAGDVHLLLGFHLAFEVTPAGITFALKSSAPPSDAPCSQRPGCVVL